MSKNKTYQLFNKKLGQKFTATEEGMKLIMADKHLSKETELLGEIVNGELITSSAKEYIENIQTINLSKDGKPKKESTDNGSDEQKNNSGETEQENKVDDTIGKQEQPDKGEGDGNVGDKKESTDNGSTGSRLRKSLFGKNTNSNKNKR